MLWLCQPPNSFGGDACNAEFIRRRRLQRRIHPAATPATPNSSGGDACNAEFIRRRRLQR
jgi:hypothetical protein